MAKEKQPDGPVGFNLATQKLHCLIALNDEIGEALSNRAGVAFFRSFIVEDRETGEILANQRFRYTDGDSWATMKLGPDKQSLSRDEKIKYLADGIEKVLRTGLAVLSSALKVSKEAVTCFYPPEPDDASKTMDWLIAQDLVQMKEVHTPDGRVIPVGKEGTA